MLRKAKGIRAKAIFPRTCLVLAVWLLPLGHRCVAEDNGAISRSIAAVKTDFGNFYLDRANLTKLGIGVAGAAVFANTSRPRENPIGSRFKISMGSAVTRSSAGFLSLPLRK